MTEIYLIRHGQASFGTADYDRLSDLGRRQSILLGRYWRRTRVHFNAVFTGPLRRHIETARHVMAALASEKDSLSPRIIDELEEIDTDRILAIQRERLLKNHPHLAVAYRLRHQDPDAFRRVMTLALEQNLSEASAPSADDVFGRFASSVQRGLDRVAEAAADMERVAVFTSGGTIAAALQAALDLDPALAVELGWKILNTSVSVIETGGERMGLNAFNLTAHLDLEAGAGLKTLF
jgi:broad specificity phosphatase PhoE